MRFKYIGDDKSPPVNATVYGCFFTLNEETEVTDPEAILKLMGSPTFEAVVDEESKPEAPAEPEPKVPVTTIYAKPRGRPKGPSRT